MIRSTFDSTEFIRLNLDPPTRSTQSVYFNFDSCKVLRLTLALCYPTSTHSFSLLQLKGNVMILRGHEKKRTVPKWVEWMWCTRGARVHELQQWHIAKTYDDGLRLPAASCSSCLDVKHKSRAAKIAMFPWRLATVQYLKQVQWFFQSMQSFGFISPWLQTQL